MLHTYHSFHRIIPIHFIIADYGDSVDHLLDGDAGTVWNAGHLVGFHVPNWVVFDFWGPVSPRTFRYRASGDNIHDPVDFSIDRSDDGSTFATVGSFTGVPGVTDWQQFPLAAAPPARYWRWRITTRVTTYQAYVADAEWDGCCSEVSGVPMSAVEDVAGRRELSAGWLDLVRIPALYNGAQVHVRGCRWLLGRSLRWSAVGRRTATSWWWSPLPPVLGEHQREVRTLLDAGWDAGWDGVVCPGLPRGLRHVLDGRLPQEGYAGFGGVHALCCHLHGQGRGVHPLSLPVVSPLKKTAGGARCTCPPPP
eukprot:Sspe_Gene.25498::Locus_10264_Transcript_1_1_Confidence_1.000_Length_1410::g.25498::m.25498